MARLRVQEAATERGLNLSQLWSLVNKRATKPVAMGTMRRYWHSTDNGLAKGGDIELVNVHLLGTIAKALGVRVAELLNEEELGELRAA